MRLHEEEIEFTLDEIAKELQLPKETCRQVLLRALRKIKATKNRDKMIQIYEEFLSLEADGSFDVHSKI